MAKYRVICEVKVAKGWQSWTVEAPDKASALDLFESGKGVFEDEEIEVQEVGEPVLKEVTY